MKYVTFYRRCRMFFKPLSYDLGAFCCFFAAIFTKYRNRPAKFAAIVRYYRNCTETKNMRYLMGDPNHCALLSFSMVHIIRRITSDAREF